MRSRIILLVFLSAFASCFETHAQLTKSTWLAGGSASYASKTFGGLKTNTLTLEPRFGYFFVDKFAAGIGLTYQRDVTKTGVSTLRATNKSIGPFARYYFLTQDNPFNILAHAGYEFGESGGTNNEKESNKRFWIGAGPTYFLNGSVGIELLASYERWSFEKSSVTKTFMVSAGFQIYLERNN